MNATVDLCTARTLAADERWFEVLGLSPYASDEDIKRVCRAARVSTHSDRGHDQLELAQIVNQAADEVARLATKPFGLYTAQFGEAALPPWALRFETVLTMERQQRNWEAFEHHLRMYKNRVEDTAVEQERADAELVERLRQVRERMKKDEQIKKDKRAALLRRLKRGFTARGTYSRELTEARREHIRVKRGGRR